MVALEGGAVSDERGTPLCVFVWSGKMPRQDVNRNVCSGTRNHGTISAPCSHQRVRVGWMRKLYQDLLLAANLHQCPDLLAGS